MENYLFSHSDVVKKQRTLRFCTLIATTLFAFLSVMDSKAQISGNVFNDNNSNGVKNTLHPNEKGIIGATIKAYVGSSSTPISKTSDFNGDYAFSAAEIPAGSKVRLEFASNIPYSHTGLSGAASQTSIQFVTAPVNNASIGFLTIDDYCQVRPPYFAIPCYVTGDPLLSTGDITKDAAEGDALVAFDYLATGIASATNYPPLHLGLAKDIGAIWGVGFHARTNHLLSTAVVKRHAGLGSLGTGGIYKSNVATGVVTPFVDVQTLGVDTGMDPHIGLPADKNLPSTDSLTFGKVGKVGIGAADVSVDGLYFYFQNLYDKKLYRLNLSKTLDTPTASDVKSYVVPNGGCSNNEYVNWSVTSDGPVVYVGVTCTAETSQLKSDLKAVIYKLDTAGIGTFTKMLEFPLDFVRGSADNTGDCVNITTWSPWTNTFPAPCVSVFVMKPQPILSDVYFDDYGHMIIGFTDRFGHQAGNEMPDLNGNGSYQSFMGGDMMRAFKNPDGSFTLENNGSAGTLVGSGVGNGEGLGGGEFFSEDSWKFFGKVAHEEVLNGGLLVVPGYDEVLTTSFDPIDEVFLSSGWQVFDVNNGSLKREFAVFGETDTEKPYVRNGTFGKAAALGNGRAMCNPSPIEVGNRIWLDKDVDGIQDPDEEGVDGIEVLICDATTNQVVGKDTTSDGGRYFFNSQNIPVTATNKGLEYEKDYIIKINKSQPALASFNKLSTANVGTSDLIDSDGTEDASNIFIAFKTGDIGQTNHTFDFGIIECLKLDSLVVTECDFYTNTYRVNSYVSYNNTPIKNLQIKLIKPDNTVVLDSIFVPTSNANQQLITIANLNSNGLAGLKLSIVVVGGEADPNCKIDTTFNAPEQCTQIVGDFLDPMGYFYCEETGEIIKGASIEILGAKPAIILEDGTDGIYRFMVDPTAFGVYTIVLNIPAGYELSDKCKASLDTLQLAGNPNPFEVGNGTNDEMTFMKSNACTTYYLKFNIQFGDPMLHFNNIALKGCCTTPIAGNDTTVCLSGVNTINLKDATQNQFWKPVIGNHANANIDSLTGVVTGMTAIGKYQFQLIYGLATSTCRDTIAVTVAAKPTFIATTTNPTCIDGSPSSNGTITLSGFETTDHASFSLGTTYTGTTTTYATAATISSSGIITNSLPSPTTATQAYTIRVFNASGCFKDTTLNLLKPISGCDKGSIGDFVWKDTDNDGIQDTGEAGVSGVIIELYKNGIIFAKDTTDAIGKYLFPSLSSGTYKIKVLSTSLTNGCLISAKSNIGDDTKDSDVSNTTGESGDYIINLEDPTKKDFLTIDVALYSLASMGDYAWYDLNQNGIQDNRKSPLGAILGKELPARGVVMALYKADGTLIGKDTTDVNGFYQFTKLQPDSYYVRFDPASYPNPSFVVTRFNSSLNDSLDSDIPRVAYQSVNFSLNSGQHDPTWDMGFFKPGDVSIIDPCGCDLTIGYLKGDDYIYREKVEVGATPGGQWMIIDRNPKNGAVTRGVYEDNGEGYVKEVNLATQNYFMTEDSLGKYSFNFSHFSDTGYSLVVTDGTDTLDINAICYQVREQLDPKLDNVCATQPAFQLQTQFATGTVKYYFLADSAFAFRPGFNEATLIPLALARGEISTLDPSKYKAGSIISLYAVWTPFATSVKGTGCPKSLFLNVKLDTTARCNPKGSIGDFVWKDTDNDGIQDTNEAGVSGVQIELYKNGTVFAKDTTDATGQYLFSGLSAGTYKIKVLSNSLPSGCMLSAKQNVGDDAKDSDVSATTGESGDYIIDPSDATKKDILTVDVALYTPKGSIGDFIWKDTDNDGVQDAGEAGVSGVIMELLKSGTVVKKDTTNGIGQYLFEGLDAGSYSVRIVKTSLPAGCLISSKKDIGDDNLDSDFDPVTGITGDYEIDFFSPVRKDIIGIDGALFSPKSIFGDFVWKDTDNDGVQDSSEPGVAGVQVELYKNGVLLAKDTTDAFGKYLFTNLDGGSYKIKVLSASFPANCLISPNQNIGDDTKDSDVSSTTGESDVFSLDPTDPAKKDVLTVDVGLYNPCVKPVAGKDTTVCGLDITTIDLKNAIGSERWAIVAGNPSPAAIDELSGTISNLLTDGTYQFQLMTSATCSDTISVIVGMKPIFTANTTKVTCTAGTPNSNGMLTLSSFTAGNRYAFVKSSTYNGIVTTFEAAQPIPSSGIISSSLVNPATATEDYTIRVFNPMGCYSDITVKMLKEANCCVPICIPFVVVRKR